MLKLSFGKVRVVTDFRKSILMQIQQNKRDPQAFRPVWVFSLNIRKNYFVRLN